ncbi:MAG: response regulator [Treponema sp.]|nr:response regulator [Treponema sp.]
MEEKKLILVVDDMVTDLVSERAILEKQFNVRICKSVGTALKMLETLNIDLILLDIEMPGMSGFEFLHTIKKFRKYWSIPIVIVSSHNSEEVFSYALKQGADDCVSKPINSEELLGKIQKVLMQRRGD